MTSEGRSIWIPRDKWPTYENAKKAVAAELDRDPDRLTEGRVVEELARSYTGWSA